MKPPARVTLFSGRVARFAEVRGAEARVSKGPFESALATFASGVVRVEGGEVGELLLADFHALRAIAMRCGLLADPPIDIECVNCDAPMRVSPCSTFELGPFVDAELHDPELDAPLALDRPHTIPAVRVGGTVAKSVTLQQVTANQARPLWAALERKRLVISASVVRALGVAALGEVRDPAVIADALQDCDDDAFDAIGALFVEAHYPLRLLAVHVCPECGARNDVDAPYERELSLDGDREPSRPFVDEDAFDAFVRERAERLMAEHPGVELVVATGTPDCDAGGIPLLGSYTPPDEGDARTPSRPAQVTVYFRTFRGCHQEDAQFDWKAEVLETLEHELEHHGAFLRGHDETDEDERDEIARDATRLVGKREVTRRVAAGFGADLVEFARRTWPIWIVVLIVTIVVMSASK